MTPTNPHLYVALDAEGIEHAAGGPIQWSLPEGGRDPITEREEGLVLYTPYGLLEVLDEVIWRAEAVGGGDVGTDGELPTHAARLVAPTRWGTEQAARFALQCAAHVLTNRADVSLPDGATLGQVVSDAEQWLDELAPGSAERLGYLGRLAALWRLHREHEDLSDVALGLLSQDATNDLDALDDPAYEVVQPLLDAVLAAIEAVRHHVLPRFEMAWEDRREEREQHDDLDGRTTLRGSDQVVVTPIGNASFGGGHLRRFEPAWTAAREAARHARREARDQRGDAGEDVERSWQAATLGGILDQPARDRAH